MLKLLIVKTLNILETWSLKSEDERADTWHFHLCLMTWTKHLSAFVSNFKAIRVVLRKFWLKNWGDPHSKSAHFIWFTQTETELINVYRYVFCLQKPFPLVHYTINKQRRCHFCSLWSYLVIFLKYSLKFRENDF